MTLTNPISVSTASDILSYIPHILGFQPQESIVFLTMSGKRVGATLRLDLPSEKADPLEYAQSVREYLAADATADGVLMMLYTQRDWTDPEDPPFASLVHCIDLVLNAGGLAIRDGWLVSPTHWRDYFCGDTACCSWPGSPLATITESLLNAELVYQGSSYADSIEAAMGEMGPAGRKDVGRLVAEYARRFSGAWESTSLGHDALVLWDCLIFDQQQEAPTEDPEVLAFLLAGLTRAALRDSLIVLAAAGLSAAATAACESGVLPKGLPEIELPPACARLKAQHLEPDEHREHPKRHAMTTKDPTEVTGALFSEVFLATGAAPDWERLDAAHAVFVRLSTVAKGEPRSALLSILGWLEWGRGRGSRAHRYLSASLAETPGYKLAELLIELVGTGSLAPWARRRETAWTTENRKVA